MSFLEPIGTNINPYTGYPFRKENLDERIRRLLEDDADEIPPIAPSSVQIIKDKQEKCPIVPSPPANVNDTKSLTPIQPSYKMEITSTNRFTGDSIKQTPTLRGTCSSSNFKNLYTPVASSRFAVFMKQSPGIKYEKEELPIYPVQQRKMSSISSISSMDSVKQTPVLPGSKYIKEKCPILPPPAAAKHFDAKDSFTPIQSSKNGSVSSIGSVKETSSVANNIKRKYSYPPIIPVQPSYKFDPSSSSKSAAASVKQQLPGNSSSNVKDSITPPPTKRIKLDCKKLSFSFINDNRPTIDEKGEPRHLRSILRHMDDWLKREERKKVYQGITELTKKEWPNPQKVTKDVKVTALNVNEFAQNDVLQMMLDSALNNPDLFEAYESIFAKKHKSKEKK
uniref:Uncharacterized protein n=1 Tax=Panagrolaimus sp. PS1159 TaxID=55785 RepID=A0AC35FKH1_9BILA